MSRELYYQIADIIHANRTWIDVVDTERVVEFTLVHNGSLRKTSYKTLTLRNIKKIPGYVKQQEWNISEYDIKCGITSLKRKDSIAADRIRNNRLTIEDVEYIIEFATFGILILDLYRYEE